MGAGDDVDAVDLMQRQPLDLTPELHLADLGGPRTAKTLCGKRDPAGLRKRQGVGQDRPMRAAAQA